MAARSSWTSVSVRSSSALARSFETRSTPGPKTRSRSSRAWSRASWPTSTDAITSTGAGRPPSSDAPRPRAAATAMNTRMATAARCCISRRAPSGVTRRGAGDRLGRVSWSRMTRRPNAPPAAERARLAPACAAATPPLTVSASGIGERSGAPASGSGGRTGTSVRPERVTATSDASRTSPASLPVPPASTKRRWRCSMAGCGWSVTSASLSSSGPRRAMTFGETSTSWSPTATSPRQTSGSRSGVGSPRSRCGSGSVERRAPRLRYASAGPTVATYSS